MSSFFPHALSPYSLSLCQPVPVFTVSTYPHFSLRIHFLYAVSPHPFSPYIFSPHALSPPGFHNIHFLVYFSVYFFACFPVYFSTHARYLCYSTISVHTKIDKIDMLKLFRLALRLRIYIYTYIRTYIRSYISINYMYRELYDSNNEKLISQTLPKTDNSQQENRNNLQYLNYFRFRACELVELRGPVRLSFADTFCGCHKSQR